MKNTLKYISIQHELGMAIGLDLKLAPMLKTFSQVCIRRLNLSSMQYYISMDEHGMPSLPEANTKCTVRHFLGIPQNDIRKDQYKPESRHKQLDIISKIHIEGFEGHAYRVDFGAVGHVIIRRLHCPIEETVLELLKPVFSRLALSCQASIEHELLLQAIDENRKARELILYQLRHDELTQLPNRRLLIEELGRVINESKAQLNYSALCFLDMNRFKAVNDSFGHAVGDGLLIAVSVILQDMSREHDVIARLSGDEFVILLPNIGQNKDIARHEMSLFLTLLQERFKVPLSVGEMYLHITPSVGVEIFPFEGCSPERVLRHADIAMYHAKQLGHNSYNFYDECSSSELEERITLEKELKFAVKENNEFHLVYQPQFDSDSVCVGAEALLRWNNREQKLIPPALFIPIAEETGLMLELGHWVIEEACQCIKQLEEKGFPENFKSIAVNVSAVQFNQKDFIYDLLSIIHCSDIKPQHLSIELTESMLITNVSEVVAKIKALRGLGITVSVDDFGTGYSSLSYLSQLPIEALKIDQSFVRNIHLDHVNRSVVAAIIALAHSLGLRLIAEGVEAEEEVESLKELGCGVYQGYFFARPLSFEAFQAILYPNE